MKEFFQSGILLLLLILVFPKVVFAQEEIKNFDVSVTAHKDGSLTVKEDIEYDFGAANRHGIFRTIPLVSKVGDLYRVIEVNFQDIERDGKEEKYEVDKHSDQTEVKIGDPDRTITGAHNYIIIYTVKNGIGSNYEDHDEIYWNVTGNDWEVPIERASYSVETDFDARPLESVCYTGQLGAKDQNCRVNGNQVNIAGPLEPGGGLTIATKFPVNTFPKSVLQKTAPVLDRDIVDFFKIYIPVVLVLNLLLGPYLLIWYFRKKAKTRFGKPSVNFDIPKNISPAEAGIIDNAKLERDDVVATIFDLAIIKYIKIEEFKEVRPLMPDKTDHKLVKLKEWDTLNGFEKTLMQRFFAGSKSVKVGELKSDFYITFSKLEKEAFESLVAKKLYTKNPKAQMALLLVSGIIATVIGNIILGPVLIFLSRKLNGRTGEGDKVDFAVDGLKIFLKAMSRHYKFQTKSLITVEKYIPYAIALGLQDEFMEQLKVINPEYKPSWYSGSRGFYYFYPGMYSSFGSNLTTTAPSSSSGFSSGGFSGGGGGGGGGGSW